MVNGFDRLTDLIFERTSDELFERANEASDKELIPIADRVVELFRALAVADPVVQEGK